MLITSYTKFMTSEPWFQNTYILRRPGVASFAYIIKILTMFLETIFKYSRKVKRIRNYVSKCNLYLSFLILQIPDFWWKDADVSRTQGLCHVIHIFCGPSLGKVQLVLERGAFLDSPHLWAFLKKPILNRINLLFSLSLR